MDAFVSGCGARDARSKDIALSIPPSSIVIILAMAERIQY